MQQGNNLIQLRLKMNDFTSLSLPMLQHFFDPELGVGSWSRKKRCNTWRTFLKTISVDALDHDIQKRFYQNVRKKFNGRRVVIFFIKKLRRFIPNILFVTNCNYSTLLLLLFIASQ